MENWSSQAIAPISSRAMPMQWRGLGVVLLALLAISGSAQAQDAELGSLPLAQSRDSAGVALLIVHFSHDASDEPDSVRAKPRQQAESGTSNDRILWTMPNFLTLENAGNIPALTPKEKFAVTARGVFDPFEFVLIGFVASINQASDSNPTYGGGMQGYAKRYGTAYADNAIENFMASAVFPSALHQDPRYYQLGEGGFFRRTKHALSRVLFTRSDSGQKQLNYSEIGGGMTAAAISTYSYHPESERGFGNVVSVWGSQMGWDAVTYMIKEFWPDLRKHKSRRQELAQQTSDTANRSR